MIKEQRPRQRIIRFGRIPTPPVVVSYSKERLREDIPRFSPRKARPLYYRRNHVRRPVPARPDRLHYLQELLGVKQNERRGEGDQNTGRPDRSQLPLRRVS